MDYVKGLIAIGFAVVNIVLMAFPFFSAVLLKVLAPSRALKEYFTRWVTAAARQYNKNNGWIFFHFIHVPIHVQGMQGLSKEGSYLVISNHQSWTDIPALQYTLERHIPLLKFFIKRELIYVPILGAAWWALDFPFMKRHSKEYLLKHPEKRGEDIAETHRMCERFRGKPVSVMSFLEGTRYTHAKHARQNSPFRHLLTPKVGGAALVMGAMGDSVKTVLDVTLNYHSTAELSLLNLLLGKVESISIQCRQLDIPEQFLGADYEQDPAFRQEVKDWFDNIWKEKDALLDR